MGRGGCSGEACGEMDWIEGRIGGLKSGIGIGGGAKHKLALNLCPLANCRPRSAATEVAPSTAVATLSPFAAPTAPAASPRTRPSSGNYDFTILGCGCTDFSLRPSLNFISDLPRTPLSSLCSTARIC